MEEQHPSVDHTENKSADSREDGMGEGRKERLPEAIGAFVVAAVAFTAVFVLGMPIAALGVILACFVLSLATEVLARYSPIALVIGWTLSMVGGFAVVENWSKVDNTLSVNLMLLLCLAGPLVVYHKFKSRHRTTS